MPSAPVPAYKSSTFTPSRFDRRANNASRTRSAVGRTPVGGAASRRPPSSPPVTRISRAVFAHFPVARHAATATIRAPTQERDGMATASVDRIKRKLADRIALVRGDRSQRQFARDLGVFQQNVN